MTSPAKPETPEEIAEACGMEWTDLAIRIRAYGDRRAEEMREWANRRSLAWLRSGKMQLHAGEMTKQELLTAKAIVSAIAADIEALPPSPATADAEDDGRGG